MKKPSKFQLIQAKDNYKHQLTIFTEPCDAEIRASLQEKKRVVNDALESLKIDMKKCWSVFCGDEINDDYLTKKEALELAAELKKQGYIEAIACYIPLKHRK